MAYTTIDNPTDYFTTVLTTSTGSALTIDTGFKPDWLWTKARNQARSHELHDTTRGDNKRLKSDATTAEESYSNYLAFTSTGATLGTNHNLGYHAGGSTTGVCWAWKANGGSATATGSESGSNPAYSVQANTTAGFSIVTYTGTGSNGTVPHGLGVKPDWYIIKNRDNTTANDGRWMVWHKSLEALHNYYSFIFLHLNNSRSEDTTVVNATPNTTTFALGDDGMVNNDGEKYVAYCFAEKQGYSKFGSWTGNANDDGPFIYTGFKPAFLLFKNASASERWFLSDNKRDTFNSVEKHMRPDVNEAEYSTTTSIDYLSNGFKIREDDAHMNGSDNTIIYMAFAESPFVSSKGVPTTAR